MLMLRDVKGNALSHHGTRHVYLTVGTQGQRANIEFQVADIFDNKVSLENPLRNGFVSRLNGESHSMMYHRNDPTTTVPLFLHKDNLRVYGRQLVHHVSLVAALQRKTFP